MRRSCCLLLLVASVQGNVDPKTGCNILRIGNNCKGDVDAPTAAIEAALSAQVQQHEEALQTAMAAAVASARADADVSAATEIRSLQRELSEKDVQLAEKDALLTKMRPCTGDSALLRLADCVAWQLAFDQIGGTHMTACADSRDDPCGCKEDEPTHWVTCSDDGTYITQMRLRDGQLNGTLPDISDMSNLTQFIMGESELLTGDVGRMVLPHGLKMFAVFQSPGVTGDVTQLKLPVTLRSLSLSGTGVTGDLSTMTIPEDLGRLGRVSFSGRRRVPVVGGQAFMERYPDRKISI